VFTEFRQVVLEYLLEQLQGFLYLAFIEGVEGHDRVLSYHVTESDKGGMLIHVE